MIPFFRKIISSLLVISFLMIDVASCMEPEQLVSQSNGNHSSTVRTRTPSPNTPSPPSDQSSTDSGSPQKDSPPRLAQNGKPIMRSGSGVVSVPQPIPRPIGSIPSRGPVNSGEVLYEPTPPRSPHMKGTGRDLALISVVSSVAKREQLKTPLLSSAATVEPSQMGDHADIPNSNLSITSYGTFDFRDLLGRVRRHGAPSTRQFLGQFKHQVIDGLLTRDQQWSVLGAGVVAAGACQAAVPVLMKGLFYLNPHLGDAFAGVTPVTEILGPIIMVTLGLDSFSRNTSIFVRLAAPSKKAFRMARDKTHEWAVKGAKVAVYTGSTLVAVLPFYYFYSSESAGWRAAESGDPDYQGPDALEYKLFFGFCVGPYVLNAIVFNGDSLASDAEEALDEHYYAKARLSDHALERRRQDLLGVFEEGERLVNTLALPTCCCCCEEDSPFCCEGEVEGEGFEENRRVLRDLYDAVYGRQFRRQLVTAPSDGLPATEEEIRQLESLRVFLVFRTFHQRHRHQLLPEDLQEGTHWWSKAFSWTHTLLSTVGKGYALWWVIDQGLGNTGAAIILGSLLANGALGRIEWKAMKEFFFDLLGGKNIQDARSHPWVRRVLNFINYNILGPFYSLPYVLLGLKATQGWSAEARLSLLLFYATADPFRSGRMFRNSYGDIVTGADRLLSYCAPSEDYMRNKLKEIQRGFWGDIYLLSHSDLRNLVTMVDERDLEQGDGHEKTTSLPRPLVERKEREQLERDKLQGDDIGEIGGMLQPNGSSLSNDHRKGQPLLQQENAERSLTAAARNSSPSCGRLTYAIGYQLLWCCLWAWFILKFL